MSINKTALVQIYDRHDNGIGTGFFISSKGYILTCYHVLDDFSYEITERVRFSIGEEKQIFNAVWIDGDSDYDIAVLETKINTKDYYALNSCYNESLKADVSGYPTDVHELISTRVTVDGILHSRKLQLGHANAITLGFSGAPIVFNGVAVGMVQYIIKEDEYGKMRELALGLSSSVIIEKFSKYVTTNELCVGFGEKAGKCTDLAVRDSMCKECFSQQYMHDLYTLFEAQNYLIHKNGDFFVVELVYGNTSYYDMIVPIIKFDEKIVKEDLYPINDYESRFDKVITRIRLISNAEAADECSAFIEKNHIQLQTKEDLLHSLFNIESYKNDLEKYAYSEPLLNHYIEIYSKYPFTEERDTDTSFTGDEDDFFDQLREKLNNIVIDDYVETINDNREYLKDYVNEFLLSSHNALLILGEYGSGKTSFCYNYALDLLDQYCKSDQSGFFPIMIKLRGYNKAAGLNEIITNYYVNELGIPNFNIHSLKIFLKNMNVLLILDGFDEIAKKADFVVKSDVLRDISEFVEQRTKVIMTCRPNYFQNAEEYERLFDDTHIFYEPGEKPRLKFIETTIAELTPYQVQSYICSYDKELQDKSITLNDIVTAISRTHDLTDLSKRPFLLYMILRTLPDILNKVKANKRTKINAAKLYEQYTDNWIKREERKNKTLIKSEDKKLFCKELAFELYLSDSTSLSYWQFPDSIRKYFLQSLQSEDIDYFSHDIQSCSFLTSDRTGDFQFIHKSFMEYFVAERVVSKLLYYLEKEWNLNEINEVLGKTLFSMEICLFIRDILDIKSIDINVIKQLFLSVNELSFAHNETVLNLLSILSKVIPNIGEMIEQVGITDLSYVDLSFSKFSDSKLSFYSFEESHFYSSSFENMKFYNCSFNKAVFEKTTMKNVTFENCVFSNSIWKEDTVDDVCFGEEDPYNVADDYTDFSKSNWKKTQIHNCRFNQCVLTDNSMTNVSIHDSKFRRVDFSNTGLFMVVDSNNNDYEDCIGLPYEMK